MIIIVYDMHVVYSTNYHIFLIIDGSAECHRGPLVASLGPDLGAVGEGLQSSEAERTQRLDSAIAREAILP